MAQSVTQDRPLTEIDTKNDVELKSVVKRFESETAVDGIDLTVRKGEFFSILGPSGCGKTTTLRLIAGFDSPTSGEIYIRGKNMAGVPPYRRPINTVFQSYALFSHMTVWDNIAFGLRLKRLGKTETRDRVAEALSLVKMEAFARRFPSQLSGGQQQRVALARALVNRPTVVLLDEPLGALDLKLRKEMQVELSNLHKTLGVTFVMVTHDQEEALSLSDRIAVMNKGLIEQIGSPSDIYENPQTPFVADFIGDTNLFQGFVDTIEPTMLTIVTEQGNKMYVKPTDTWQSMAGHAAVVSIRPEKVHVSQEPPNAMNVFEGHLKHRMYLGTHVHYLIELRSGESVTVLQPNRMQTSWNNDAPVYVHWDAVDCLALPA